MARGASSQHTNVMTPLAGDRRCRSRPGGAGGVGGGGAGGGGGGGWYHTLSTPARAAAGHCRVAAVCGRPVLTVTAAGHTAAHTRG